MVESESARSWGCKSDEGESGDAPDGSLGDSHLRASHRHRGPQGGAGASLKDIERDESVSGALKAAHAALADGRRPTEIEAVDGGLRSVRAHLATAQVRDSLRASLPAFTVASGLAGDASFAAAQRAYKAVGPQLARFQAELLEVSLSYRRAADSVKYLRLLKESNWPLFLIDKPELVDGVLGLHEEDLEANTAAIEEMAVSYLDESWVQETRERWESFGELSAGEMAILAKSLDYHARGEYHASVSMLMGMLEGLLLKYSFQAERLAGRDLETFNWLAGKFGLEPIGERGERGRRNRFAPRDYVVLYVLNAKRGLLVWQSAGMYIDRVVLASDCDEDMLAKNPLRHKICHGAQTNYGTVVHSLKAILSTDIVMRLGRAAAKNAFRQNGDDAGRR